VQESCVTAYPVAFIYPFVGLAGLNLVLMSEAEAVLASDEFQRVTIASDNSPLSEHFCVP